MRNAFKIVSAVWLLFLAVALFIACTQQPPVAPTQVNVTQTVTVGGGDIPGDPNSSACPTATRVDVIVRNGTSILSATDPAGLQLDATPKPPERGTACNEREGIAWTASGACHMSGNVTGFDPFVVGQSGGENCTITACVRSNANACGTIVLPVR